MAEAQTNKEGRLSENILYFARALRAAGIPVGPGARHHARRVVVGLPIRARDRLLARLKVQRSVGGAHVRALEPLQLAAAAVGAPVGCEPVAGRPPVGVERAAVEVLVQRERPWLRRARGPDRKHRGGPRRRSRLRRAVRARPRRGEDQCAHERDSGGTNDEAGRGPSGEVDDPCYRR